MKFSVVLCFTFFAFVSPQDDIKHECENTSDCPKYNYCFYSYWLGQSCVTNSDLKDHRNTRFCLGINPNTKETYLDHSVCGEFEAEKNKRSRGYSTWRCYRETGYTCRSAYFMPCNANYDERGNPIKGGEESCPENFICHEQKYQRHVYKVCLPKAPAEPNADTCKTNYDCGFSDLSLSWSTCYNGVCERVIEK